MDMLHMIIDRALNDMEEVGPFEENLVEIAKTLPGVNGGSTKIEK